MLASCWHVRIFRHVLCVVAAIFILMHPFSVFIYSREIYAVHINVWIRIVWAVLQVTGNVNMWSFVNVREWISQIIVRQYQSFNNNRLDLYKLHTLKFHSKFKEVNGYNSKRSHWFSSGFTNSFKIGITGISTTLNIGSLTQGPLKI